MPDWPQTIPHDLDILLEAHDVEAPERLPMRPEQPNAT